MIGVFLYLAIVKICDTYSSIVVIFTNRKKAMKARCALSALAFHFLPSVCSHLILYISIKQRFNSLAIVK